MSLSMIARVLWLRRILRARERWNRSQLQEHQQRELATLRVFASARSPFYRRLYAGLDDAPLAALPVLTKATLMDNFDQISTDPAVRLSDVQSYLAALHGDQLFRNRYWVSATSGSPGRKSIIVTNTHEWATIIASYGRANEWAGIHTGLTHRVSMAVVSSTAPWHQSSRVAATVRSPFVVSERLDAATPLPDIVTRLNQLQPDVLIAYASMIRVLAGEQLGGRLQIAPRGINSSSEVLTATPAPRPPGRGRRHRSTSTPPPRPVASRRNATSTKACTCSMTWSSPKSSTTTTGRCPRASRVTGSWSPCSRAARCP